MPDWRVTFTLPVAAFLLLTPAPAKADPALIRRADLSFAETAPGLLREADRLRLWAMTRRETYDLPEPDVLEWQPDADDPEDDEGWQLALEGQAITAEAMGRAEGWLALATLAERAALRAGPAPLAREALGEMAAAAATNALLLADKPSAVQAAALVLARLRERGGDADTALRTLTTASRLPQLASDAALNAMAAGLQDIPRRDGPMALTDGQAMRFEGWTLVCTNDLSCTASLAGLGGTLRLARASGPGGALHVTLILTAPDAKGAPLPQRHAGDVPILRQWQVRLDGQPFGDDPDAALPFRASPDLLDGWAFWDVPPLQTDAALAALRGAHILEMMPDAGGMTYHFPLSGLDAALGAMDEVQGRVGTETALIRRGTLPADAVSPPARLVSVPAPTEPLPGRARPDHPGAGALALWRALCPGGGEEPVQTPLGTKSRDGADIWLLPCGLDADTPVYTAIYDKGGVAGALLDGFSLAQGQPPSPLLLGDPQLGPLSVPGYGEPHTRRPLALISETGGPCPRRQIFVWTGQGFARVQKTGAMDCAAPFLFADMFFAFPKED